MFSVWKQPVIAFGASGQITFAFHVFGDSMFTMIPSSQADQGPMAGLKTYGSVASKLTRLMVS